MNIHTGARRLLISFVCVFMAFLLLVGSFPAQASQEDSAGEIPVVKRWEGEEALPERVTVKLLEKDSSIRTLTLTAADAQADGNWQGSFQNIPLYDSQGRPIDYTAMMWAGIAFLLMCPYALNDSSVREGMSLRGRGGKPIRRISRANRVMVTCLIAVALIIACAGAIRDAFQRAGAFVMHWVGRFIMWLMSLAAGSEGAGGGEGGGNMDLGLGGEAVEPSWFAKFMEQVMKYFVVLVLIVLVIFVLWKLGKLMARLARRISAWARRFAQGVKEDYLEEHEQLMDWGEVRGEMLNSVKDTLRRLTTREKKWGDMDARERVRYVMRQLYRRRGAGISGIEYLSAQEALGEMAVDEPARRELGQLYDEARYSDHEITEAQAEAARRVVK